MEFSENKKIKRSEFLKLTGIGAGMFFLSSLPFTSKIEAKAAEQEFSFAIFADSHTAPYFPARSEWLNSIFQTLLSEKQPPEFILHLGDVVEAGLPDEYKEFERLVPSYYQSKIYATQGNHEARWDEWAGELFSKYMGKSQYSFNYGGIHFIALDPTQLLQEPGYFTQNQLDWLANDLKQTGKSTPVIIYLHYPIGDNNYYIINEGKLFETVESYNIRAVFTGHVHKDNVWKQNGIHIFSLAALRNGPYFQLIKKRQNPQGKMVLDVISASIVNGALSTKYLDEVPLTGARPAETEKPLSIKFFTEGSSKEGAELSVNLHPHHQASTVEYQFWPDARYAGTDQGNWQEMTPDHHHKWTAQVNTDLPPGEYQLQVRVHNHQKSWWDSFLYVQLPNKAAQKRILWEKNVQSPVQAGLAVLSVSDSQNILISANSDGLINGIDAKNGRQIWSFQTNGPVLGTPQINEDVVYIGSSDRKIYALNGKNGQLLWNVKCPQPVLGSVLLTEDQVLVPSGNQMLALERNSGKIQWQVKVGGFTAGQPAVDNEAVYFGAGDGYIYALYLQTGEIKWKVQIVSRANAYSTLINSAWATHATVIPDQLGHPSIVYVSTVSANFALNRETGKELWKYTRGFLYSAPLIVKESGSDPVAILANEWGEVSSINPYTGKEYWKTTLAQRIFDASPVQKGELVYITGVNGLLSALNIKTGAVVDQYHFASTYAYSTPVIVGEQIIQAAQDGIVRSIQIPLQRDLGFFDR
ncbi:PQQ-binding-like beta-propeller repeat protein [Niallia sp. Krafla_26]|uniref:outer membrane protein assembly factor BamB family protein n=1 Tax=Niallia sp. Krafla_26 TaxID=3064703 RepID=UPI003D1778B1